MAATANDSTFTVGDAIAALTRHHPKSAVKFSQIYAQHAHTRLGTEQALKDYLCVAKDEPLDWLRTFPTDWKSASVFNKAMAAVNHLIKLDEVVQAMNREDPTLLEGLRTEIKSKLTGKALEAEARRRRMIQGDPEQPEMQTATVCAVQPEMQTATVCAVQPEMQTATVCAVQPEMQTALESKTASAKSKSQAFREACLHVAQGSMIGVTLAGLWESGAFPMEEPHVLARVFEVLFADNNSIEAFKIVAGSLSTTTTLLGEIAR
jgi:hypothetical protein